MLVLRLEIWPGGSYAHRRTIGEVQIVNVSELAPVSDYKVTFLPYGDDKRSPPKKHAEVLWHKREDGAWSLVRKALAALRLGA